MCNYEKLRKYRQENHAIKEDRTNYTCRDVYKTTTGKHFFNKSTEKSDIDKFGVGIVLYFRFLKMLLLYFFIFTLL